MSGTGRVWRPKYTHKGERRQSAIWWMDYSIDGKRTRERSGKTRKKDALKVLHQRLAERGRGLSSRDLEKVKFEDLEKAIRADYQKKNRKSEKRLELSLGHLRAFFGGWRVVDIAEEAIDRYTTDRLDQGRAPATVNRELAALKRMFRLGRKKRLVGRVPAIDMLAEDNVRTGFVEEREFRALLGTLPPRVRPIATAAYVTGWRLGELLSREWRHVDFQAGWIRLEPGETKNGEGRQFPLLPRLREALEAQHARKREIEQRTGQVVRSLFFYHEGKREGEPIRDFRTAWATAAKAAGVPDLLFHDLRRSAVRNLVRAGVPEKVAMELTGHRTRSVFDRYAIVDEAMLQEAGEKLTAHFQTTERRPERKVVDIREARG